MRRVRTALQIERNECGLPWGVCLYGRCQNAHKHVGRHHCKLPNCGAITDTPTAHGQNDSAQILLGIDLDSEGNYKVKVSHNVVVTASLGGGPSSCFMAELIKSIKADLEKKGENITGRIHPGKRCLESEDDAPSPYKRRYSVARGRSKPEEDAPVPYRRPHSVAQGRSDLPSSAWRDWHPGDPFDDDGNFIGPSICLPDGNSGDQSPDDGHNVETYGQADPESNLFLNVSPDADQRGGTVLGGPGTRLPSLAELCAFGDKAFADSIAVRKERRKAREERVLAHPKKKGGKGTAGGEGG